MLHHWAPPRPKHWVLEDEPPYFNVVQIVAGTVYGYRVDNEQRNLLAYFDQGNISLISCENSSSCVCSSPALLRDSWFVSGGKRVYICLSGLQSWLSCLWDTLIYKDDRHTRNLTLNETRVSRDEIMGHLNQPRYYKLKIWRLPVSFR